MNDYEIIFGREHDRHTQQKDFWLRAEAAYSGGKVYLEQALIRHVSEVEPEFEERRHRACYFNYPRRAARLISQFVLSEQPQRLNADPDLIEDFSRDGLRVNEVMRQVSTYLNCFGLAWLIVDMPAFNGKIDLAMKKQNRIRPYARALKPQAVTDWHFGADGKLLWAIVEENGADASNPLTPPARFVHRRLWERNRWTLFSRDDSGAVCIIDQQEHHLGRVPLVKCEEADGFGMGANHWFEDVVRISDAILNAESEAQMNIIKQMFGLLVVSESFRNGDFSSNTSDSEVRFSHVLARSAALWEMPEEKGISRYIAPSGTETAQIRSEIINLKKELFEVIGLAVQKDSKTQQTAESKAWDHQNVSQFLASRADLMEQTELQTWQLMHHWDTSVKIPEISYNREFSILDLKDSIEALLNFNSLNAGNEFRREVARSAVKLLGKIKKIDDSVKQKIEKDIASINN
jgi:hypothetical protein